jgi:hypothetical protein
VVWCAFYLRKLCVAEHEDAEEELAVELILRPGVIDGLAQRGLELLIGILILGRHGLPRAAARRLELGFDGAQQALRLGERLLLAVQEAHDLRDGGLEGGEGGGVHHAGRVAHGLGQLPGGHVALQPLD